MTTTVRQTALTKALAILNALKLPHAVMDGETKHGTLDVVVPRKHKVLMYDHVGKHDYMNRIKAASAGDMLTFKCANDGEGESLRGSIASYAIRLNGAGSVMTEYHLRKDFTVQALIISKR